MDKISCRHELCAADHTETARHCREIADGDTYLVTATWTDDNDPATGRVQMTYEAATVTLTAREAAFWARVLTAGAAFGQQAEMAIDLGAAAEVLSYLDPEPEPLYFGAGHLDLAIKRTVARFFDDDDEPLYFVAHTGSDR